MFQILGGTSYASNAKEIDNIDKQNAETSKEFEEPKRKRSKKNKESSKNLNTSNFHTAYNNHLALYQLPEPTPEMKLKLKTGELISARSTFMKHQGSYLLLHSSERPSPRQYDIFATTICNQHKELQSGKNGNVKNFKLFIFNTFSISLNCNKTLSMVTGTNQKTIKYLGSKPPSRQQKERIQ